MTNEPTPVPGVERIVVLRANGMGDYVLALPALQALRAAYPTAEITLLGRPWHAAFLRHRSKPVDEVIGLPVIPGLTAADDVSAAPDVAAADDVSTPDVPELMERLRRRRFDLAVQLHGGGRFSNPFINQLGAGTTAGLRTPDAEPLDRWLPYIYLQPEVVRNLEVAGLAGARPTTFIPEMSVSDSDLMESLHVLPDTDAAVAALHPGAFDVRRRWPVERFAQVGDALAEQGATVVVTGSTGDVDLAARVVAAMRHPATSLAGRLSLGGLLGLYSRTRLVVGNDTGPLHLAGAIGTGAVGIYWCPNFVSVAPFTRARFRPLVAWTLRCPRCGAPFGQGDHGVEPWRPSCDHWVSWVSDVSVEQVIAAASELWLLIGAEADRADPVGPSRTV